MCNTPCYCIVLILAIANKVKKLSKAVIKKIPGKVGLLSLTQQEQRAKKKKKKKVVMIISQFSVAMGRIFRREIVGPKVVALKLSFIVEKAHIWV